MIKHDHGAHRDGPCPACNALKHGGKEITCSKCGGSGESKKTGDPIPWCRQCGGNGSVILSPIEIALSVELD